MFLAQAHGRGKSAAPDPPDRCLHHRRGTGEGRGARRSGKGQRWPWPDARVIGRELPGVTVSTLCDLDAARAAPRRGVRGFGRVLTDAGSGRPAARAAPERIRPRCAMPAAMCRSCGPQAAARGRDFTLPRGRACADHRRLWRHRPDRGRRSDPPLWRANHPDRRGAACRSGRLMAALAGRRMIAADPISRRILALQRLGGDRAGRFWSPLRMSAITEDMRDRGCLG